MSMRRPKCDKSATATSTRSGVIDFKEGYLMAGAVDHLPVEAEPVKDTPVNDILVKATPATDSQISLVTNGMVADWWAKIKGWMKMKVQNKETQNATYIEAQKQLFKMSHADAKHIEQLVDADVDEFATKYLAGFTPDTITQVQLDALVSIGKDVHNNALCNYIHKSLNAQSVPPKPLPIKDVKNVDVPDTISTTNKFNSNQVADHDTQDRFHKKNTTSMKNNKTSASTDASKLDMKMSMRELQPRLAKAVTETLDSYGIHDNGMIDTKKMARMHQLETLLHS